MGANDIVSAPENHLAALRAGGILLCCCFALLAAHAIQTFGETALVEKIFF